MKEPNGFWRLIAVALFAALLGGAPGYFLIGPLKPNRIEVSTMILKEAPAAVSDALDVIKETQKGIEIRQARMSVQLDQILKAVVR